MKKAILFLYIATFISCKAGSQEKIFTTEAVKRDLNFAFERLTNLHPGLHRYTTKEELKRYFNKLLLNVPDSMNIWQAHSYISQLIGEIRCGHTRLFPNMDELEKLKKQPVFFPLPSRWLSDSLYVRTGDAAAPKWWRVESINNVPVAALLSHFEKRFALDGESRKGKQLFFDNLAYYYAVLKERPTSFVLKVKSVPANNDTLIELPALTWQALEKMRAENKIVFGTGRLKPFEFRTQGQIGFLTVRNFNGERHRSFGYNFPAFLDSAFQQTLNNKITHLVIDIRNNGGGDDAYGALLYSHLTNKPFYYFKEVVTLKNGAFVNVSHPQLKQQPASAIAYLGKTSLLVDGLTFSTAADFAAIFKEHNRGLIVGMETGGAFQGNNSGPSSEVTLPNTGIVLSIPLWRYTNAVKNTKSASGVMPDVEILPTIFDVYPGMDRAKAYLEAR
jgi:hypothetical protein